MVLLVILFQILQTGLVPHFMHLVARLPGLGFLAAHTIDLVLLAILYLSLRRTTISVLVWVIAVSVLSVCFGLAWKGAFAASCLVVAMVGILLQRHVLVTGFGTIASIAFSASLLSGVVYFLVGKIFSGVHGGFFSHFGFVIIQSGINALVAPLIYRFLEMADKAGGGTSAFGDQNLILSKYL